MGGRIWMIGGIAVGLAMALGEVRYFAGSARSLAETAELLVGSAGKRLIAEGYPAARSFGHLTGRLPLGGTGPLQAQTFAAPEQLRTMSAGAGTRVALAATALVSVLVPGVTAWLLVLAARGSLLLRKVLAAVIFLVGVVSFAYHGHGVALGTLTLAAAVGGAALVLTGPVVVAPLCALAGLIGGTFVPRLVLHTATLPNDPDRALAAAVTGHATSASPSWAAAAIVVVGLVPFAVGLRALART